VGVLRSRQRCLLQELGRSSGKDELLGAGRTGWARLKASVLQAALWCSEGSTCKLSSLPIYRTAKKYTPPHQLGRKLRQAGCNKLV